MSKSETPEKKFPGCLIALVIIGAALWILGPEGVASLFGK